MSDLDVVLTGHRVWRDRTVTARGGGEVAVATTPCEALALLLDAVLHAAECGACGRTMSREQARSHSCRMDRSARRRAHRAIARGAVKV